MRFNEGWNLVSPPAPPINSSIEAIFADNLTRIKYIFTYQDGEWLYWIRGMPSTLEELHLDKGYWIFVEKPSAS